MLYGSCLNKKTQYEWVVVAEALTDAPQQREEV
jgi:hypothetical protein